jgi:hypothetical protein
MNFMEETKQQQKKEGKFNHLNGICNVPTRKRYLLTKDMVSHEVSASMFWRYQKILRMY